MVDQVIMKRLALTRYLYTIGIEQSQRPEPLSSASILTFHDSVELFLQLSCEIVGAGKSDIKFMEYWDLINSKLTGAKLTQKESLRRLNTSRVNFKHHGTLPSKLDIESFRASVTNFFNENTPTIFSLEFSSISLIEIVQSINVREKLKSAVAFLEEYKIEDALDSIALSFEIMVDEYELSKRTNYGHSPFFFGESLTFHSSFFMGIGHNSTERKLGEFIDKVKDSIESLQKAVKLLSLGLDYKKYSKFKLFIPYVTRVLSGDYVIQRVNRGESDLPTVGEVQFCIDFVIESSFKLQEFDFSL